MVRISDDVASAIRAVFDQDGELSAAMEVRRQFPGITDNECAREWSPGGPMLGEAIISATLQRLHVFRPSSRLDGVRLSRVELRRLRAFVLANLSSPLHLDDLSKYMNTSIRHLSRTLKTTTGFSPHQFVTRCRLSHATQLLTNSKASLDEIADASGFADRSHMSTVFRKSLNLTPSQIRNGADQAE